MRRFNASSASRFHAAGRVPISASVRHLQRPQDGHLPSPGQFGMRFCFLKKSSCWSSSANLRRRSGTRSASMASRSAERRRSSGAIDASMSASGEDLRLSQEEFPMRRPLSCIFHMFSLRHKYKDFVSVGVRLMGISILAQGRSHKTAITQRFYIRSLY